MKIIDITLSINENIPVYPGDAKFKATPICTIEKSGCNMQQLNLGTHTGTHIDAPLHFLANGSSIDEIPLEIFFGKSQVIEIDEPRITKTAIDKFFIDGINRVLFKTPNSYLLEDKEFHKEYVYLTEDGADFLINKNVKLVGIDYISIERFGTADFIVHKKLFSANMCILEGINLKEVDPGIYTLVAFPLPFEGLDGSPVRAVLIEE